MSFSNYAEGKVLDHVFGISAYTQPSLYVALSTTDPTDAGTGITEPSGDGYARVAHSGWSRSGDTVSNSSEVTFPQATASWGTITHFAVFDALTGGNMVAHGALASGGEAVNTDATPKFAVGDLSFTLD